MSGSEIIGGQGSTIIGVSIGDQQRYGARAAALLGRTDLWQYWNDFVDRDKSSDSPAGFSNDISGGSCSMGDTVESETGGVVFQQSSAVANSRFNLYDQANIFDAGTKDFYFAARMKVATAIDAQTVCCVGLTGSNISGGLNVGVFGAGSTAQFVIQNGALAATNSGNFANIGAFDGNWHVIELTLRGTACAVYFDGVLAASPTVAAPGFTSKQGWNLVCQNGTTAINRRLSTSWILGAGVR
jgi:hypothetical protein